MSRARIKVADEAHRTILTYTLPDDRWMLPVLLWCAAGGLAVGIGAAVVLTLAGLIGGGTHNFTLVMGIITLVAATLLYTVGYLAGLRKRFLRITFDYARCLIELDPSYIGQRRTRYALEDVEEFRVVDCSTVQHARCALVMVRRSGPQTLLVLNRPHDDERSGLPQLAARLDAQLSLDPARPDDDLPHLPPIFTVTPPVPARRGWSAEAEFDGDLDAPETYDLDRQQSPK
jgi:hypothetical protein